MWSLVTLESKKMSLLLTFWSNNKNIVSVNFVFKSILKIDENNWYIVQKVGGEPLKHSISIEKFLSSSHCSTGEIIDWKDIENHNQ